MSLATPEKIRSLQRKLYCKASFPLLCVLYDKICRDRVVQTAAKLVLEPIFEADFEDNAYGYLFRTARRRRQPATRCRSVATHPKGVSVPH